MTGPLPTSAASMAGSLPSMPSAQMPTPRVPADAANCALSESDVASSNQVWCHCLPTLYEMKAVCDARLQYTDFPAVAIAPSGTGVAGPVAEAVALGPLVVQLYP